MTARAVIASIALLFLITAGAFFLRRHDSTVPLAMSIDRAGEQEDRDAPEFQSLEPYRFRPTRWTSLDDVGTNHRCNQDASSQLQNECPCIANPANPDVLLVGSNDYVSGNVRAGFYRSTNGGETWLHALYAGGPTNAECIFAGDPSVAADATGKLYAVYCAYVCSQDQGVYSQTSVDNGQTWAAPVSVGIQDNLDIGIDKPHAACDYSPGSPYVNNCYVAWMNVSGSYKIQFSRSVNGGQSFSNPIDLTAAADCWCPCVTVGSSGEVFVVWMNMNASQVRCRRSLDGGVNWEAEVIVASCHPDIWGTNICGGFRAVRYPAIACDISAGLYQGNLYVVWERSVVGNNTNIYISKSVDGGLSWSDTVRVNDDNTNRMQWWPWIAVHPVTGDVGISWCDRREDPQNCNFTVYGTISTDGGDTWSSNMRISDRELLPGGGGFLGDYTGATFSNLGFFSTWPDTRNDEADIYSAWWNLDDEFAIVSPNGGESWALQQPCTLRWHYRYAPDSLFVELNRSYPAGPWERLDTVRASARQWNWTSTGPVTSAARFRLIGINVPSVGDSSDADFSIEGLVAPERLTARRIGQDIRLRWLSTGAPYYRIYSALAVEDSLLTYEGTTSSTVFIDSAAVADSRKFYIIRASSEP